MLSALVRTTSLNSAPGEEMLYVFREDEMSRYLVGSCCLGLAIVIAGCSGQASPPASIEGTADADGSFESLSSSEPETFPQVITAQAEYYTSSPAQGRPPDGSFPAGTKVRIRRNTGSYSLVRSADGVEGYIRTESVADAPVAAQP